MTKELELKIYHRRKDILNGPHIEGNIKQKRQMLLDKFIGLLLYNNYVISDIKKIEFIDYFSFEITMKNNTKVFILSKEDRTFLSNQSLIHYEPVLDRNLIHI